MIILNTDQGHTRACKGGSEQKVNSASACQENAQDDIQDDCCTSDVGDVGDPELPLDRSTVIYLNEAVGEDFGVNDGIGRGLDFDA